MSNNHTPDSKESQIEIRLREILDNVAPPRMMNRTVETLTRFISGIRSMKNGLTCTITNSDFSWIMDVDDKHISFNGSDNAQYFRKHYESLGYNVIFIDKPVHYTLQPPCYQCGSNAWLQMPEVGAVCAQCNKPVRPTTA